VLEEHEADLEKEFKFTDAAEVRVKLNQLKIIEEEKAKDELKQIHEEEVNTLELERDSEMTLFNEEYDSFYNNMMKKFEDTRQQMNEQHKKEFEESIKIFNENFPEAKSSPEILDLHKKLEGIVKRKE
jgi:hypothetical protein